MKLPMIAVAALALFACNTAMASADADKMAAFQADCRKYAEEDGVAGDELEDYIAQCLQDLTSAQAESSGSEDSASDNERD